jgi:hypothetical protein
VSIFAALVLGAGLALRVPPSAAEGARSIPPPVLDEPANPQVKSEVAVLAGGCFWGVQGVFQHVEGVTSAVSGYAGGGADTAHYEMVGTNATGHAESVRVTFDPRRISYGHILQIYFSVAHDPGSCGDGPLGRRLQGVQHFDVTVQNMDRPFEFYTEVLGGNGKGLHLTIPPLWSSVPGPRPGHSRGGPGADQLSSTNGRIPHEFKAPLEWHCDCRHAHNRRISLGSKQPEWRKRHGNAGAKLW